LISIHGTDAKAIVLFSQVIRKSRMVTLYVDGSLSQQEGTKLSPICHAS
jgi:hypothetical protein